MKTVLVKLDLLKMLLLKNVNLFPVLKVIMNTTTDVLNAIGLKVMKHVMKDNVLPFTKPMLKL